VNVDNRGAGPGRRSQLRDHCTGEGISRQGVMVSAQGRAEMSAERSLSKASVIQLTTTGRRTGRPHTVELSFAYRDGYVYLLAGIPRDWHKNLLRNPSVTVSTGGTSFRGVAEPIKDEKGMLEATREMFLLKYGASYVAEWYERIPRIPVKIRIEQGI